LEPDLTHLPEDREYYTKETKPSEFAPQSAISSIHSSRYLEDSIRALAPHAIQSNTKIKPNQPTKKI